MSTLIHWLRHTLPAPGPAVLAMAGGAVLVIGLLAALILTADEGALAWENFSVFYGVFCFPVVVVLLAVFCHISIYLQAVLSKGLQFLPSVWGHTLTLPS